jgi:hypothetical protein
MPAKAGIQRDFDQILESRRGAGMTSGQPGFDLKVRRGGALSVSGQGPNADLFLSEPLLDLRLNPKPLHFIEAGAVGGSAAFG